MKRCTPNFRCRRLDCPTCTWRYTGQIAQRIDLSRAGGPLLAVEISGFKDFETWRVSMRNLVDHRRRVSVGWDALLTHVWLCHGGTARGIIGTGSVGISELVDVVGRRWPIHVRLIEVDELRVAVYRVVQQVAKAEEARYQHVKLAIWPRRKRACAASFASGCIEPMPVVL